MPVELLKADDFLRALPDEILITTVVAYASLQSAQHHHRRGKASIEDVEAFATNLRMLENKIRENADQVLRLIKGITPFALTKDDIINTPSIVAMMATGEMAMRAMAVVHSHAAAEAIKRLIQPPEPPPDQAPDHEPT